MWESCTITIMKLTDVLCHTLLEGPVLTDDLGHSPRGIFLTVSSDPTSGQDLKHLTKQVEYSPGTFLCKSPSCLSSICMSRKQTTRKADDIFMVVRCHTWRADSDGIWPRWHQNSSQSRVTKESMENATWHPKNWSPLLPCHGRHDTSATRNNTCFIQSWGSVSQNDQVSLPLELVIHKQCASEEIISDNSAPRSEYHLPQPPRYSADNLVLPGRYGPR